MRRVLPLIAKRRPGSIRTVMVSAGLESQVDAGELAEALEKESGADQEKAREGDLGYDQGVPETTLVRVRRKRFGSRLARPVVGGVAEARRAGMTVKTRPVARDARSAKLRTGTSRVAPLSRGMSPGTVRAIARVAANARAAPTRPPAKARMTPSVEELQQEGLT